MIPSLKVSVIESKVCYQWQITSAVNTYPGTTFSLAYASLVDSPGCVSKYTKVGSHDSTGLKDNVEPCPHTKF